MMVRWPECRAWRHGLLGSLVVLALTPAALISTPLSSTTRAQSPSSPSCTRPAMIVFDGSGSMMATTDGLSRLQSAKLAMERVVPPVSAIRPVGLTVYSGNFNVCDNVRVLVTPAVGSGPAILDALSDVQPGGATPLGAAVRRGVTYFRERAEAATLVVVTDGEESCGDNICQLANQISESQPPLEVHVIGYGLDRQQEQSLRCLSSRNSGRFTTVNTTGELVDALQQALSCGAVSQAPTPFVVAAPVAMTQARISLISTSGAMLSIATDAVAQLCFKPS
jgi:Ca-activated chloride channel homolog